MRSDDWKSLVSRSLGPALWRQEQLGELIDGLDWTADLDSATIRFGELAFDMQVLGTWFDHSWLWSWANELPTQVTELATEVKNVGEWEQIKFFGMDELPIEEDYEAFFFALVANSTVTDNPIYWGPNGDGRVAISVAAQLPALSDPLIRIPRVLSLALDAPFEIDHAILAVSLLKEAGLGVLRSGNSVTGSGPEGSVHIGLDAEGRITEIDVRDLAHHFDVA